MFMAKIYVAVTKDRSIEFPTIIKRMAFMINARRLGVKIVAGSYDTKTVDGGPAGYINKLRKKLK